MNNLANHHLFCRILSALDVTDEHRPSLMDEMATANWQALIDIANSNYLIPAFCSALKRRDLLQYADPLAQDYMQELHQFNFKRSEAIERQLSEIVLTLNEISITPIFLKGAAALADQWQEDKAARFMFDVDILIGEERVAEAYAALEHIGYFTARNKEASLNPLAHHLAPLQKQDAPVLVELHKRPLSFRSGDLVNTSRLTRDAIDIADKHAGRMAGGGKGNAKGNVKGSIEGCFKIPSPTCQVLMSILHTELGHHNHLVRRFHIRHSSDLGWLSRRYARGIDWLSIKEEMDGGGLGDVLAAHLYLQQKFFGLTTPATPEKASAYALHHHKEVCRYIEKPGHKIRSLKLIYRRMATGLSRQNLSIKYGGYGFWFIQVARLRQLAYYLKKYCNPAAWRRLLESDKKVLGLTATTWRSRDKSSVTR